MIAKWVSTIYGEAYEDVQSTIVNEVKDLKGLEQGKQPPLLDIVEPSKKWTTREHHTRSFENI